MGLLKLGSIYKKSKSKKEKPETPPLPTPPPTLEPLSLNLDLNLSSTTQPSTYTTATKQPINNDSFMNTPATSPQPQNTAITSGSLFDDIFSELNPNSNAPKDGLQSDISLALALSNQLSIENTVPSSSGSPQNGNKSSNNNTKSDRKEVPNFLLGEDSIYSSYLRNLSSLDNNDTSTSNSNNDFSTSMFASLMGPTPQQSHSQPRSMLNATASPPPPVPSAPATTNTVLDSDISDSDDSKMSDDSDANTQQKQTNKRMTKGIQPIMERRPQDHHLLVQRKIDNWSNRVDPEANKVESREAIISRMKDRHRNEVKMAALRQQQQQNMMGMHMVPQVYGAPPPPIIPQSQPIVSPHPGMMLDPYASLSPQQMVDHRQPAEQYPMMHHSTSTPPAKNSRTPNASMSHSNKPVSSKSTPTSNNSSTTNLSVSSSASSVASNGSLKKKKLESVQEGDQKKQKKKGTKKNKEEQVEIEEVFAEQIADEEVEEIDRLSSPESSSLDTTSRPFQTLDDPDEADVESSGEDDVAATIRKKKSLRKLRQKKEDEDVKQVRSFRSTPNLKKKQGKKSKSSRSSSRRNSQDATSSPNPEYHYQQHHEESIPRSQSHNMSYYNHHQPIRHLKSESDLRQKRAGPSHQLNFEYERMQAFQREQQLKNKHKFNQQQQNFSPQVIYAPVYYPSSTPYNQQMDNNYYHYDPRASAMPGYGYPPSNQQYYTR